MDKIAEGKIRKNGDQYELDIDGFRYIDYDRHKNLSLFHLTKYGEYIFLFFGKLGHPKFDDENYYAALLGQKFQISQSVYKNSNSNYHMKMVEKPPLVGNKTLTLNVELVSRSTGEVLMKNERLATFVDRKKRKAIPVPKEEIFGPGKRRLTRFTIEENIRPSSAYKFHYKAAFYDVDFNHHVNAWSYIRWVSDGIAEAACKKGLKYIVGDQPLCAKSLEILYINECFAGDSVCIYLWDMLCDGDNIKVCFEVEKYNNDQTVRLTYGNIKYFTPVFSSQL